MSADEFKTHQARANLTSVELAKRLGVSERTVYRYRSGYNIPGPVALLMRSL